MKLDLVIWTLNSARTLPYCLKSIEKAIPHKLVNQKIMVDGHSRDDTVEIGERFDWQVYDAEKVGIPYQANQALALVTMPIFASFEHDVVLHPHWLNYLYPHLLDKEVAVAQGLRISTQPTLKKIEEYSVKRSIHNKKHLRSHISIDNNLYKTDIIRNVGGFPTDCLISTDQFLREKIEAQGYKWIINPFIVSHHLKNSVKEELQHIQWCAQRSKKSNLLKNTILLFYSPVSSLKMAYTMKYPQIVTTYPRFRLARLKGSLRKE